MRGAVDTYFDDVLVMAENETECGEIGCGSWPVSPRACARWRTSSGYRVETVGGREKA